MQQAFAPAIRELLERGVDEKRIREVIAKAVPTAIDESAEHLAKILRKRAPELVHQRRFLAAFRKRLAARWGKAFTLFEIVLICATEAGEDFNRAHRPRASKERDVVFHTVTLLHARACLVAAEVYELLKGGYPNGAHARCRTLHELSVFGLLVADGGREIADRFLLHDLIDNAKNAEVYQKYAKRLGERPLTRKGLARIYAQRDVALDRFGKAFKGNYGWAAPLFPKKESPTFGQLEERAGLDHLRPYYDLSTHLGVHASSKGARLTLLSFRGRRMMLAGPTNAGLADPGIEALESLLQITSTLLTRTRPLGHDLMPIIATRTLAKLVGEASAAFLQAHNKLEVDERRARRRKPRARRPT